MGTTNTVSGTTAIALIVVGALLAPGTATLAADPQHDARLALAQAFVRSLDEVHAGVACVQVVTELDDRQALVALMGQFRCAVARYAAAARTVAPWRGDADEWIRTTASAAHTAYDAMAEADRAMIPLLERTIALQERRSRDRRSTRDAGSALLAGLTAVRGHRQDAWRLLLVATAGLGEVLVRDGEDGSARHVLTGEERAGLRARLHAVFGPAVTRPPYEDEDADLVAGGLLYALLRDDPAADEPWHAASR